MVIGWARKTTGKVYHAFQAPEHGGSRWRRTLCGKWILRGILTDVELPVVRRRCRTCMRAAASLLLLVKGKRQY